MSRPPTTPDSVPGRCELLRSHGFEFFVVATTSNLARFDLCPFGVALQPVVFPAPAAYGWDPDTFVRLFHSLNTHVFTDRSLTMPNWVLVDHALLSSGLLIVACPAEGLDEVGRVFGLTADERSVLASLKAEAAEQGFTGPIPVAAYCAAPTADPERRVGWSLCSVVPRSGLGFVAKCLALGAYRTRVLSGTTQYDNHALRVHTKFGPARMLAAVVNIHTAPHTLLYQTDLRRWLNNTGATAPEVSPTWMVSVTDSERQAELQTVLDARSHTLTILPPGLVIRDGERLVPILVSDYVDPDIIAP